MKKPALASMCMIFDPSTPLPHASVDCNISGHISCHSIRFGSRAFIGVFLGTHGSLSPSSGSFVAFQTLQSFTRHKGYRTHPFNT